MKKVCTAVGSELPASRLGPEIIDFCPPQIATEVKSAKLAWPIAMHGVDRYGFARSSDGPRLPVALRV